MAIPDRIGVSEDQRIDITVRIIAEVVEISGRVIDFCRSRGVDERRSFYAGLCMEEMAANIVEHGFTKDKKSHSVDIRVIATGEKLILRLRDECAEFDPTQRAKAMETDAYGKNIGIKLVYRIADTVDYQNLLGLNVLTISV